LEVFKTVAVILVDELKVSLWAKKAWRGRKNSTRVFILFSTPCRKSIKAYERHGKPGKKLTEKILREPHTWRMLDIEGMPLL